MVSFFLFILIEMTALFSGLAWQLNQLLDSSRLNWLVVGGGIGCGVALGLIGGWLAGRPPPGRHERSGCGLALY